MPAPPPSPVAELAALRAELDRIDDGLHDLLVRRAAITARIGASAAKGAVKLRPGREAAILRRLLARHSGPLPPAAVVRVWRELFAGSIAMQGPFTVAAPSGLDAVAREHFGALVPLRVADPPACLALLRAAGAGAAVLPLVQPGWTAELRHPPRLFVVARLPVWTGRPPGAPHAPPALVVTANPPDPSGADRTLLRSEDGTLVERDGFPDLNAPGVIGGYAAPLG